MYLQLPAKRFMFKLSITLGIVELTSYEQLQTFGLKRKFRLVYNDVNRN